jgi:hypothetical protein
VNTSRPVSPLPRIERVPAYLSLRRRSSLIPRVQSTANRETVEHDSSNESIRKLKSTNPDSPPSRSHMKSSTNERAESPNRRRKNQIIAAEMLM